MDSNHKNELYKGKKKRIVNKLKVIVVIIVSIQCATLNVDSINSQQDCYHNSLWNSFYSIIQNECKTKIKKQKSWTNADERINSKSINSSEIKWEKKQMKNKVEYQTNSSPLHQVK